MDACVAAHPAEHTSDLVAGEAPEPHRPPRASRRISTGPAGQLGRVVLVHPVKESHVAPKKRRTFLVRVGAAGSG